MDVSDEYTEGTDVGSDEGDGGDVEELAPPAGDDTGGALGLDYATLLAEYPDLAAASTDSDDEDYGDIDFSIPQFDAADTSAGADAGGLDLPPEQVAFLDRMGFDVANARESDPERMDRAAGFLADVRADDHFDQITSQINPVGDEASLLNEEAKHRYVAEALGARRRWGENDSDANFEALTGAARRRLEEEGVQGTSYVRDEDIEYGGGSTVETADGGSEIRLSDLEFYGQEPTPELVDTVYHESVHAEQRHIAAGVTPEELEDPSSREARLAKVHAEENEEIYSQVQQADRDSQFNYAYIMSPNEQEAHQAGRDVRDMYQRVGAMHDELEGQERGSPMDAVDDLEDRLEARRQEILEGTPEQARLEGEYAQPEGAQ